MYQALSLDSAVWRDKDVGIYKSYTDCISVFQKHHLELAKEIEGFFNPSWMEKVYIPITDVQHALPFLQQ